MSNTVVDPGTDRGRAVPREPTRRGRRIRTLLGFRNISALYILVALLIIFSIWIPEVFWTVTTLRTLLDGQAVVGLAAVGLMVPLAAGVYNLAVGFQVGLAGILVGSLMVSAGVGVWSAIVIALVVGGLIGLASGLLVVKARINSFIATLGISSLLGALITAISGGRQILGLPEEFAQLGVGGVGGITIPVLVLVVVAAAVWYVLEKSSVGRRIYATGGNIDAARLAGVRTSVIIVGSLVACGVIASIAGILVTARLANADPTVGPSYLLPAFTAAFLGSTQFKGGRFNVLGTVVSVYVLAVGVKGLQLAGAPVWIPDAFNGAALLLAVGMAAFTGPTVRSTSFMRKLLDRRRVD